MVAIADRVSRFWLRRTGGARVASVCVALVASAAAVAGVAARAGVDVADERLRIYVDADFTHAGPVARDIVRGIRTALEVAGQSQDYDVLVQDHRGNARRSFDTLEAAASDERAVAVIGGMHSPPYMAYRREIGQLGIPVLVPWAAGAPVTRHGALGRNWVFRVSVDDAHAISFLASEVAASECDAPGVIVADTPWGVGNAHAFGAEADRIGLSLAGTWRVPTGARNPQVLVLLGHVEDLQVDCLVMFGDGLASRLVLAGAAMMDRPPRLISHWGVLGSQGVHDALRVPLARIDLRVLGTCGLERLDARTDLVERAQAALGRIEPAAPDIAALPAAHGFFHAFDATLLLLDAVGRVRPTEAWTHGMPLRRAAIRHALYTIDGPVPGFMKDYVRPFRPYRKTQPDGHEALGISDLCLQRIDAMGRLRPARVRSDADMAGRP